MNRLSLTKRAHILHLLVEGNSLRAASRIADVSVITVMRLLVDVGKACAEYQHRTLKNLPCKRVQVDELWSFCYAKQKNIPEEYQGEDGIGDVWTWVSICADTKIVPCWYVGNREWRSGYKLLADLKERLAERIQLTTDGYKAYPLVVESIFGQGIDYAQLVKQYDMVGKRQRYIGAELKAVVGNPRPEHISTSFVERQNLTMRMGIRRYTRKTNAFSKKIENHNHAVALHFMYYNFCRIHKSLRVTPAMAAGVTDHVWELEEILTLLEEQEKPKKRGSYKKRGQL